MRIAYLTQEFPPHSGGIGTYVYEAARAMAAAGHDVEVFTPDASGDSSEHYEGFLLHRLGPFPGTESLQELLARGVEHRYRLRPFDVLESPEYLAQAEVVRQRIPDLPLVVKLHTCSLLLTELNLVQPSWAEKLRFRLGSWRRGQRAVPYWWRYEPESDPERALTRAADLVVSPSRSLLRIMTRRWQLDPKRCRHIPYPYQPSAELLALPVHRPGQRLTYFGRLERRKGVLDLAVALPRVLKAWPQATMRFVGAPMDSPDPAFDMRRFLEKELAQWQDRVQFQDPIPRGRIHELLAQSDICIFPSLWENFPNACLEAMAGGQAVIGSSAGGMAEIIDPGKSGLLVAPNKPLILAEAISKIMRESCLQLRLRVEARERILNSFTPQVIVPQLEEAFRLAIRNRAA